MNILVTAGNTLVPIDKVRCISNIFTGRTGAAIAIHAHQHGHVVTLLTSHPEVVANLSGVPQSGSPRWSLVACKTFDDLADMMGRLITSSSLDAVVHCAAVSDYRSAGIYAPAPGTRFDTERSLWESTGAPALQDRSAGKVKSDEPELWLRLVRTPKLVDCIRSDWGFAGLLVKFKLEVGITEQELLAIAERSRIQSSADLMVANTLEGASTWAYLGPTATGYQRISRRELSEKLLTEVENKYKERHG